MDKQHNITSKCERPRNEVPLSILGTCGEAQVFTEALEPNAAGMIRALCDAEIARDSVIRVMPDVHAGKGCVVGTAMMTRARVAPALLGGDIGCGMTAQKLKMKGRPDLHQLDKIIRAAIPAGMKIHDEPIGYPAEMDEALEKLRCARHVQLDKARRSIGTLGGGNHFIEVGCENGRDYWLIVHSGSRHLGMEVAEYYAKLAQEQHGDRYRDFSYLTDRLMADYLHDVDVLQRYARCNREAIIRRIMSGMKWKADNGEDAVIECPHNFLEVTGDTVLLRKGAIRAEAGERLIIPMNMRDGCLICVGKGNADWNRSAPHGAGRLMARGDARNSFTLTQYKKEMQGIFTTCISRETIDESPMAYKPMAEIVERIAPTAEIVSRIVPIYNFKAGGE